MIKIVLSYEDNYIDRVEKIKEEFFDDVDYFYVEDYINKNILLDFTNNDIIYILNNSTYNLQLIKEIKDKVYKIINEEFYCKESTKLKIQKELKNNDIFVPNIIEYEKLTKYEYPLFFKSVIASFSCLTLIGSNPVKGSSKINKIGSLITAEIN